MELDLFRPNRELRSLRVRDFLDDIFNKDFLETPLATVPGSITSRWNPNVDVKEDEDRYIVEAEIPGVKNEDLNVKVNDHQLTIEAERKEEIREKDEEGNDQYYEHSYGTFKRSFRLPENVDVEKDGENIDANYKNGLLRVTLPKSEKSTEGRRISVNT